MRRVERPAGDEDLDRAIGSLVDDRPSPAFAVSVMQRIEETTAVGRGFSPGESEGPTVRVLAALTGRWRLAVAASVVILLLAVVVAWFGLWSRPAPATVAGNRLPVVVRPGTPPALTAQAPPATGVEPSITEHHTVPGRPERSLAPRPAASVREAAAPAIVARAAIVPLLSTTSDEADQPGETPNAKTPLVVGPLAPPEPIVVPPLTVDSLSVNRVGVPPLKMGPPDGGDEKR